MLGFLPAFAQTTNKPIALLNVNVIPMDQERVLANQTVIVRDGEREVAATNGIEADAGNSGDALRKGVSGAVKYGFEFRVSGLKTMYLPETQNPKLET